MLNQLQARTDASEKHFSAVSPLCKCQYKTQIFILKLSSFFFNLIFALVSVENKEFLVRKFPSEYILRISFLVFEKYHCLIYRDWKCVGNSRQMVPEGYKIICYG